MDPNVIGVPAATSWYMNPFFLASFGAVVAIGFVFFSAAYFVVVKLKYGTGTGTDHGHGSDCKTCGVSFPCGEHSSVQVRMSLLEKIIDSQEDDYKELRRRVDAIERTH